MLRLIRPAATGGAAVLLLAGCGALGGGSNGISPNGSATITVAAVPSVGDAPLYLARQDGLFAQHGLTVTIKTYQSVSAEAEALANGQADIAAGDYTGFFAVAGTTFAPPTKGGKKQSIPGGTTLRVIGDGYDAANNVMEVLTLPGNKTIKSAANDLQGKTVYTPPAEAAAFKTSKTQPYNIETLATQTVLRNDGVSVTTIHWHQAAAGSLVRALEDHKANAILVGEPYLFQAQKQLGAVAVLDSASGVTDEPAAARLLHHQRLRQRPRAVDPGLPGRDDGGADPRRGPRADPVDAQQRRRSQPAGRAADRAGHLPDVLQRRPGPACR